MKKILILLLFIVSIMQGGAQTLIPVDADKASRMSLNGTWNLRLDNARESATIRVPGNWDMQGFAHPVYGLNREPMFVGDNAAHDGTYQRTFNLPDSWKGKQVWIAFDGVENGYSLFVNGDSIGSFHSAFNRSMFDISRAVRYGQDNDITVKVTQTGVPYWEFDTNDDWAFGGISRDVTLYAIPQNHIEDFFVSYNINGKDATVCLKMQSSLKKHGWQAELLDRSGKTVQKSGIVKDDTLNFNVSNAQLWSAENPYLYTLRLSLIKGKKVQQTTERKIGIRTVTWQDGVFRVNGVNVKLKGINHHDESPVNGRAETEAELLRDVRMMKAANINCVRTSHYPPSPHFMDMLDSLGIYAICEVPYGFGDKHLGNSATLPELKKRAWYTVMRDKNRPSVVIWSVGNENPVTDNGLKTAHYVLKLDPTRPNVFPNTHAPFLKELTLDDDSITMYSCHYPMPSELGKFVPRLKHPLVNTECAHALGLDFGLLEGLVREWYKYNKLAGGCVWDWADQGILKHDRHISSRYEPTNEVWLSPDSYYDMQGIYGTDGIVYPNRYPQTDYWQVRAAFSPVVITQNETGYVITNRYDFTNLNSLQCKVEYFDKAKSIRTYTNRCDVAPHESAAFRLFDNARKGEGSYAVVSFSNSKGDEVYRQSFKFGDVNIDADSISNEKAKPLSADSVKSWIIKNVRVRMGRKPTLSSEATVERDKARGGKHHLWSPYLLKATKAELKNGRYVVRFDCDSTHYVDGTIEVTQRGNGVWAIDYNLTAHGKGEALETGLTIVTGLPSQNTTLSYMGNGPYACYPGRSALSWYGSHSLSADDIRFPGNRMGVDIAMLSNKEGKSYVLVPRKGKNVCLERNDDGTISLSHTVNVASPFNKNVWPESGLTEDTDGVAINGKLDLYTTKGQANTYLRSFLNMDSDSKAVQRPFYNSYDQ